ncbi:ATP-binding protein [Streptomyces sp. NPDC059740]|uniref:ATP-binding protein n=1 Tax=Streptomyces sp. NPDC059740 TaxID=3346926 RepID=UPI0036668AAE
MDGVTTGTDEPGPVAAGDLTRLPPTAGPSGAVAEWTLPTDPEAVRAARHAVRATLTAWRLEDLVDVTVLLVSELVTNAQRYASAPIGVRLVRARGGVLRVEVSDPLPQAPQARRVSPEDEGGRGLWLVACSARRWGARCGGTGKTVWFELAEAG